jgi:AcrR family transcriptional regulator
VSRRSEPVGTPPILQAARRRFLQWGYSGTSTAQLAEDLGITKAALYYHFPDKEALFLAVVREYLAEVAGELAGQSPLFDEGDREAALGALAQVFLSRNETSAQIQQLSFQESRHLSAEGQRELSSTYHDAMVRPVSALLHRAVSRGWIRAAADDEPALIWTFLGLLTAFLKPGHEGPGTTAPSPQAFVRLFLGGLSPRPTPPLQGESLC